MGNYTEYLEFITENFTMIAELVDLILSVIAALLGIISLLIGAYYILVNVFHVNLQILWPCQNDLMRLKYDLYSIKEIKKSTFYLTLLVLVIALAISIPFDSILSVIIGVIIVLAYIAYIIWVEHERTKRILTIRIKDQSKVDYQEPEDGTNEKWKLLLRTEEGYIFSKEINRSKLKNNLNEIKYIAKDDISKYTWKYEENETNSLKDKLKGSLPW